MQEYLKVFNENFDFIGVDSRDNIHNNGYWHETFHAWFIRTNSIGESFVLFQLRSPKKSLFPNFLDITVAGHISENEEKEDGIREITEELGIRIDPDELIYAGVRIDMAKVGEITNREFCHTFFTKTKLSIHEFNPSKDEVFGIVEVPIDKGILLFSNQINEIKCNSIMQDVDGSFIDGSFTISRENVIPRIDRYYFKVFLNAQQLINRQTYLSI